MIDLLAWFIIWFVQERYAEAGTVYAEFPALAGWIDRMTSIGHGTPTDMSPTEALEVARSSQPTTPEQHDEKDPQGLKPGLSATVGPVVDSGETPIEGTVRASNRNTIVLTINNSMCGEVAVHFPRVGYKVSIKT